MAQSTAGSPAQVIDQERLDILETLGKHRRFLRFAAQNVSEADASRRTTVSELCLGGLIKHVARVEEQWADFIEHGPGPGFVIDEQAMRDHAMSFQVLEGETLTGLLDHYQSVADRTDELVRSLPSLDADQPLAEAPWFPPGARWTARRTLLHIIAETAQHAGHADIVREAIDGQKTMG